MSNQILWRGVTVVLLIAVSPLSVRADKNDNNKNNNEIQKHEKQVADAKNKLQSAKKEADAARNKAKQEATSLAQATKHADATRRKVQDEHDAAPALVAARDQFEKAKKHSEVAVAPVLAKLKQQDDHQRAIAAREAIQSQLKNLPTNQSDARGSLADELKNATAQVTKLETAAIEADPAAKSAKAASTQAANRVKELVVQRDAAVQSDARIAAAKKELEKAKHERAAAEKKLATENQQLAAAERHLNQEEQELQRQRQQHNKNTPNKNNKPRNK